MPLALSFEMSAAFIPIDSAVAQLDSAPILHTVGLKCIDVYNRRLREVKDPSYRNGRWPHTSISNSVSPTTDMMINEREDLKTASDL